MQQIRFLKHFFLFLCLMIGQGHFFAAYGQDEESQQNNANLQTSKAVAAEDEDLSEEEELLKDLIDHDHDPLEPMNRCIFEFNQLFDGIVLKPLATIFDATMPKQGQMGIRNFIDNLFLPLTFLNYILQGDVEKGAESVFRFVINSTIGIFGLFDVAQEMGLKKEMTSFNETLQKWSVESGPYLVLPFFGPSSFRDATGKVTDYFMDPLRQIALDKKYNHAAKKRHLRYLMGLYALDGVMLRTEHLKDLEELERTSLNFYVTMRSVYWQLQQKKQKKSE